MSRSEKKTPIIKCDKFDKKIKHWFNKRIRNTDLGDNSVYKRIYKKYGIYDDRYKSNLYKGNRIDGIPTFYYSKRIMTIDEINEHWRK